MVDLKLNQGAALIIVAHPDDETIWMGGTILKFNKIKWTIFSLCRGDDLDRAPKFQRVCRLYGARAIISNLEDEGIMNIKESLPDIKKKISARLKEKRFNYIFTHGINGEYGHPRHKGVGQSVKILLAEGKLKTDSAFSFAYNFNQKINCAVPDKKGNLGFKLTPRLFNQKKRILKKIYGFPKSSFEYKSCAPIESFNFLKL